MEVDETFVGGKRANMSDAKRCESDCTGRGGLGSGKVAVVGLKDRDNDQVREWVYENIETVKASPLAYDTKVLREFLY